MLQIHNDVDVSVAGHTIIITCKSNAIEESGKIAHSFATSPYFPQNWKLSFNMRLPENICEC